MWFGTLSRMTPSLRVVGGVAGAREELRPHRRALSEMRVGSTDVVAVRRPVTRLQRRREIRCARELAPQGTTTSRATGPKTRAPGAATLT